MKNIVKIDDKDIIDILSKFTNEEQEIICRFNKLIEKRVVELKIVHCWSCNSTNVENSGFCKNCGVYQ